MSIKTRTVIESYPAYDIIAPSKDYKGRTYIRHTDKVRIAGRNYTPGSCASYAIENNECPIKSYNRAIELGHNTHWLNQDASCIHSGPHSKGQDKIALNIGDVIYFEGRHFEIEKAWNGNVKLTEVEAETK